MHRLPNRPGLFPLVVVFLAALVWDGVLKASPHCYMPPLWSARYRGPGEVVTNGFGSAVGMEDTAFALAIDDLGNIYVTGFSSKSNTGGDYAAVKYGPSGNQIWAARYNGPSDNPDMATAIALDGLGNVYVTGYSYLYSNVNNEVIHADNDYLTVKFDNAGNLLWAVRFDTGTNDFAYALAVDQSGNAYVTGSSGTLKYSTDGVLLWANGCRGETLKLSSLADAILVASAGSCGLTKLDANGNSLWTTTIPAVPPFNESGVLAVDQQTNVFVAGTDSQGQLETVRFDQDGNRVWTATNNGSSYPTGLVLDSAGNVIVSGDYSTLKYDPDGNLLWSQPSLGYAEGLTVDRVGNVYVCGYMNRTLSPRNGYEATAAVLKYDTDGNLLWVGRYDNPFKGYNVATAIALDQDENVCVTGFSAYGKPGSMGHEFLTMKFDQHTPRLVRRGFFSNTEFHDCLISDIGTA